MKKILIVDDYKEIHTLLSVVFEGFYEVESAFDGKQALKLLIKNKYDLVILDRHMPIYTGLEVIEEVKRLGIEAPPIFLHTNDPDGIKYKPTYNKMSEHMFKAIDKLLEE